MPEKDDIKSVLSELKKVLSDLKKEEATGQSDIQQQPESQIQPRPTENLSEKEKSVPISKRPVKIPVPAQPKTQIQQSVSEKKPDNHIESMQKNEPEQIVPKQKPTVIEIKLSESKKEQPEVPVETISASIKQEHNLPDESLLKYILLYPFGQENSKETFVSNFAEVIKKTVKKQLVPFCALAEPINPSTVNWNEIIKKCQENKIDALFLVHVQDYDYSEIKNRFNSVGIFFHVILFSQVNKKITYVDLAV